MKNPFLQDRNIFSKVQKPPAAKNNIQQKGITSNQKNQQRPNYSTKFEDKPVTKYISGPANTAFGGYKKESSNLPPNQYNLGVNKLSSEKITFGDPSSSEAYHGERTSGYFNLLSNEQGRNKADNSNQQQKYEPRMNNFVQNRNNYVKDSFAIDKNLKQTKKFDGKIAQSSKMNYQFTPPPINNFFNDFGQQRKDQQFQPNNYQYKPTYATNLQQRPSYSTSYQFNTQKDIYKEEANITEYTPYSAHNNQSYKSPPKQNQSPFTPKNNSYQSKDTHYAGQFKSNHYAELSPIGQVSRHKIDEDSMMNLDGLIQGVELDKLLAQSKTQEELLRILGMDTSLIKRNIDSTNKKNISYDNQIPYENKTYQHQSKPDVNPYRGTNENQFIKKTYQSQLPSQNQYLAYQNFTQQVDEPEVINYGQSHKRKTVQQSTNKYKQQGQIQIKQKSKHYQKYHPEEATNNFFSQTQQQYSNIVRNSKTTLQQDNYQEEQDLQHIMQKQMQKFLNLHQGFAKDKRVFMTANQKIITKKYKLSSL